MQNQQLIELRKTRKWSQAKLAEHIGTTVVNISRWENRETAPGPYFRKKLREIFDKSDEELGFSPDIASNGSLQKTQRSRSFPQIWNVSYQRNLLFTGREDVLSRVCTALAPNQSVSSLLRPLAISGLGGTGKTQIAVEYAYRYRNLYKAVFWVRADSDSLLISDFLFIARLLDLPERSEQDQQQALKAVLYWFETHEKWLLILDNADDMNMVKRFIPSAGKGHVLLTTREQAGGTLVQHIELESMSKDEGTLFLLRRTKVLNPQASIETVKETIRDKARAIVEEMECLPLALDQAGAYLEETRCSMSDYLKAYKTRSGRLLRMRGTDAVGHPECVATTWSLSFEKIEQARPASAELLRLCAFLHPQAIPEALFIQGGNELSPALRVVAEDPLELNETIGELLRFSLVKRDTEARMLTIHRLVQTVLKDGMSEETQREWAVRAVRLICHMFPDVSFSSWPECQRLLPHAQECAALIEQWGIAFPEAAQLLRQAGYYLQERGQYAEAEPLLRQALQLRIQIVGPFHPDVAQNMNSLAVLLRNCGKYAQAEELFLRAIAIRKGSLGPEHPDVAQSLNDLAALYWYQAKYTQAEPLYMEALTIRRKVLEPDHPKLGESLSNLGLLYYEQGNYAEAEPLQSEGLAIRERALGADHPYTAISLNNLGLLYWQQQKFERAEVALRRALFIWERELGASHPNTATSLSNLGLLYNSQSRYEEAEPLFLRAHAIRQQKLASDHPHLAYSLNGLAQLYYGKGDYAQAEHFYQNALLIREKNPQHPDLAETLEGLAQLYYRQGKYGQAEQNLQRALAIREQSLGPSHPHTVRAFTLYTNLTRS